MLCTFFPNSQSAEDLNTRVHLSFSFFLPATNQVLFSKGCSVSLKKDPNLCGISMAFKQAVSYPSLSPCMHKYSLAPVSKHMLAASFYTAGFCPCYLLGNPARYILYILWSGGIINIEKRGCRTCHTCNYHLHLPTAATT